MNKTFAVWLLLGGLAFAQAPAPLPPPPVARKVPHEQTLHGDRLVDDYYWLRNKGTPEVAAYLKAEAAYADAFMKPTAALQEQLYREMLSRLKEDDQTPPYREGSYFYYQRTEKGKQYPIVCRRAKLDAPEQVLLDLNVLGAHEKFISLGDSAVSDDEQQLAYAVDVTGGHDNVLYVKDLRSGRLGPEHIAHISSVEWAADNRTLFYTIEDSAKRSYRLYRHTRGTTGADPLLFEEKDERFEIDLHRTRSRQFLTLTSSSHTTSEVRYLPANLPGGEWRTVTPRQADHEYYVDHRGDLFYITTNRSGRNFAVVTAPVADPGMKSWQELVPHNPDVMIERLDAFAHQLVLTERQDGLPQLRILDLDSGASHRVTVPEPVYFMALGDNEVFDTNEIRFNYQSPVTPSSFFDYDGRTRQRRLVKRVEVPGGYDAARYQVERVHARAADGTLVPMSILSLKSAARDGKSPLLLDGYGSYGISYPSLFDEKIFSLVDRGVRFAIAHIRGGGDLGKRWHDDGRMLHKRNTFTDFISCAEFLIAQKYTASDRLVITGGSAGGLLMGAVANMRPELFHAVVARVPFVDVINTMVDESLPLTVGEFEEWGNPKKSKEEYDYMKSYSPYDNVAARAYPALLVESSLNDMQVMYWEPAKWVAKLRATKTDHNPLLFKIELEPAGHGGRSGRYERLRQEAYVDAFILTQVGITK